MLCQKLEAREEVQISIKIMGKTPTPNLKSFLPYDGGGGKSLMGTLRGCYVKCRVKNDFWSPTFGSI